VLILSWLRRGTCHSGGAGGCKGNPWGNRQNREGKGGVGHSDNPGVVASSTGWKKNLTNAKNFKSIIPIVGCPKNRRGVPLKFVFEVKGETTPGN